MEGASSTPPVASSAPAASTMSGSPAVASSGPAPSYYFGSTPVYSGVSTGGQVGGAGMTPPQGASSIPVVQQPPQEDDNKQKYQQIANLASGLAGTIAGSGGGSGFQPMAASVGGFSPVAATFEFPTFAKAKQIHG